MAFFNALFLVALCAAAYVLFLARWVGVVYLLRVRRKSWYTLASAPAFLALLTCYGLYQTRPAAVFERSLGFAPPLGVTSLESSQWVLGDSGTVRLRFRSDPAIVRRVVAARGLRPVVPGEAGPTPRPVSAASQGRVDGPTVAYSGSIVGRDFASEQEYLTYDPASGDTHYQFDGVD